MRDSRGTEDGVRPDGLRARRRSRLRELYGAQAAGRRTDVDVAVITLEFQLGTDVDIAVVRAAVEHAALAARQGWRALADVDPVALADAGGREALEDLEFLVSRGLCELSGVKNLFCLARRLV